MTAWTKEPPSEPGYYWIRRICRTCRAADPSKLFLAEAYSNQYRDGALWVRIRGYGTQDPKKWLERGWEFGPRIEPPAL